MWLLFRIWYKSRFNHIRIWRIPPYCVVGSSWDFQEAHLKFWYLIEASKWLGCDHQLHPDTMRDVVVVSTQMLRSSFNRAVMMNIRIKNPHSKTSFNLSLKITNLTWSNFSDFRFSEYLWSYIWPLSLLKRGWAFGDLWETPNPPPLWISHTWGFREGEG